MCMHNKHLPYTNHNDLFAQRPLYSLLRETSQAVSKQSQRCSSICHHIPHRLTIYMSIFAGKKVWSATPATVRPLPSSLLLELNHTKTSPLRVAAFMTNSTELVCSTLFSNILCGNFKLWQPDKHAVHKALEAHHPHRLLAPQGSGIPKAALPFRPSAEHAADSGDLRSDKEFYNSLSWLEGQDIVQEWLLKTLG
jgi:hypothetical protein